MSSSEQKKRIILTAQAFIDAWSGGYKGVKEEDGKGYWEVKSYDDEIGVCFSNIELMTSIHVIHLKFLPHLILKNSTLKELYLSDSLIEDIFINNSTILDFSVTNSVIKNISLDDSTIGDYWVKNNSKTRTFSCENSQTENITIENSTVEGFKFEYSKTGEIGINNSQIEDFWATNSAMEDILINNKSNIGYFGIAFFSTICRELTIEDSKVWCIDLHKTKEVRKCNFIDSFIQNFIWKQDTFCQLTMDNCELEKIIFKQTNIPKDSVFQISDCSINLLEFSQFINTGWLNIISLEPLTSYDRFSEKEKNPIITDSKFQFEPIEHKDSILYFGNSDFGKTTFIDCLLDNFDTFIFHNTKMLEVFSAGTELPKEVTLPIFPKGLIKAEQERLAFGQFKKISENRGDNVQATEFLALEMDAYARQITDDSTKWGERFNLWLNKFSSNWGNDWVRAVWITLLVNTLFYTAYCHALGYRMFGTDFYLFLDLTSFSFEFLNPLRKADPLKDFDSHIKINWLARSIDYISRIFIAYFVYQTIQAFRRFGKKS